MITINKDLVVFKNDVKIGTIAFNYRYNEYHFKPMKSVYILTELMGQLFKLMDTMSYEKAFGVEHQFDKNGIYYPKR